MVLAEPVEITLRIARVLEGLGVEFPKPDGITRWAPAIDTTSSPWIS